MFVAILAVVCAFLSVSSAAPTPGALLGVNVPALDRFAQTVLPLALNTLKDTSFEPVSGKESGFEYEVKDIHINTAQAGSVSVELDSNIASIRASDVAIAMSLNWNYRLAVFPHVPYGSGSATAALSSPGIGVNVAIGSRPVPKMDGYAPTFKVKSVVFDIDNIDIKTSESIFSWLYNLIIKLFKGTITRLVRTKVIDTITTMIDLTLAEMLETLDPLVPLGTIASLDFTLTSPPTLGALLTLPFNGEAYPYGTSKSDGQTPRPTLELAKSGRMIDIALSSFVPQTLLHVTYLSGRFSAEFDDAHRPPLWPVAFNSDAWTSIPNLAKVYPHAPLRLRVALDREPAVTIDGGAITVAGQMQFMVEAQVNSVWKHAFTVVGALKAGAKVWFDTTNPADPLLMINLPEMSPTAKVTDSSIGSIDLSEIESLVTSLVDGTVRPWVNDLVNEGIPLPSMSGVHVTNSAITVAGKKIIISTDVDYTPSLAGAAAAALVKRATTIMGLRAAGLDPLSEAAGVPTVTESVVIPKPFAVAP